MLKIISADERLATPPKINMTILGASGVGKTSLVRTLPANNTLFIDGEAGSLAIQGWRGDLVKIREQANAMGCHPWELAKALACWLGGPNPADANGFYSRGTYENLLQTMGSLEVLAKYETIFVDSLTDISRLCLDWCKTQPQAFSEKTGKADTRGAYGLLGQEMTRWLIHLQHSSKSVITVGILDKAEDDLKRAFWKPQIEGTTTANALPGIFDLVMTLASFTTPSNVPYRALVCHKINPWEYPAKDRSGCLDMIEEPDLSKIMKKIREGIRKDSVYQSAIPQAEQAAITGTTES